MYGINIFQIFVFYENDLLKLQNWSPSVVFSPFVKFGVLENYLLNLWYISKVNYQSYTDCCFYLCFFLLLSRFYIAAQVVRMIYFKSLTISLWCCSFYLPFLLLLSRFYISAQPVRVDLIIEGFLGLVLCTEYTRIKYCFSFIRGTTPIFDVYFTTYLNAKLPIPKFERNKFILALCEETNMNY